MQYVTSSRFIPFIRKLESHSLYEPRDDFGFALADQRGHISQVLVENRERLLWFRGSVLGPFPTPLSGGKDTGCGLLELCQQST
jgi:hypothetical protein